MEYLHRELESTVLRLMSTYKSVTLIGPRQCGKTTMLRKLYPNGSYLNLESPNIMIMLKEDPLGVLQSFQKPIIIDEIQLMPDLIKILQFIMDECEENGQFMLTGSFESGVRSYVSQSLAGRTALINMLPLSLSEIDKAGIVLDVNEQILKGFLPKVYSLDSNETYEYYVNYISLYVQRDVEMLLRLKDRHQFVSMLNLLSGRVGSLLNYSSISNDLGISVPTIKEWISILEACHIIFLLPPWGKSISVQVSKTPKVYFCDTGLLCTLLGIENKTQLLRDPLRGSIFENMVVLEAYKSFFNNYRTPKLCFFRDSKGLEVDLVYLRNRDTPELYEIKASESMNPDFSASMHSISRKLGDENIRKSIIYSGSSMKIKDIEYINYRKIPETFFSASSML